MNSQRRDEDTLGAQSDTERVVASRSGLAVVAGFLVVWLVLRWIRHR